MKTGIVLKKALLIMTLLTTLSMVVFAYTDVKESAWYYDNVNSLSERGIVQGYEDGSFRPDESITAAEFYKLFVAATSGVKAANGDEAWWAPYTAYCAQNSYHVVEEGSLNKPIKKIEIVHFLQNHNFGGVYPEDIMRLSELFEDYEKIPEELSRKVLELYCDGIIVGSSGRYNPDSALTRAEASAVVSRIIDKKSRVDTVKTIPIVVDTMKAANESGQIITVTTNSMSDFKAKVNAYEKIDGIWYRAKKDMPAVVGSRGLMKNRKQGTYTTPVGNYGFVHAFGNKKNPGVSAEYEYRDVTPKSYWVTDRNSTSYNRWVEGGGEFDDAEHLESYGYQYNYAMVIDFNYYEPVKGDGAAIFLHVATYDGKGTAGCVALSEEDVVWLMRWLDKEENPRIIICVNEELSEY